MIYTEKPLFLEPSLFTCLTRPHANSHFHMKLPHPLKMYYFSDLYHNQSGSWTEFFTTSNKCLVISGTHFVYTSIHLEQWCMSFGLSSLSLDLILNATYRHISDPCIFKVLFDILMNTSKEGSWYTSIKTTHGCLTYLKQYHQCLTNNVKQPLHKLLGISTKSNNFDGFNRGCSGLFCNFKL